MYVYVWIWFKSMFHNCAFSLPSPVCFYFLFLQVSFRNITSLSPQIIPSLFLSVAASSYVVLFFHYCLYFKWFLISIFVLSLFSVSSFSKVSLSIFIFIHFSHSISHFYILCLSFSIIYSSLALLFNKSPFCLLPFLKCLHCFALSILFLNSFSTNSRYLPTCTFLI